jgi:hypothetical protein
MAHERPATGGHGAQVCRAMASGRPGPLAPAGGGRVAVTGYRA